MPNEIELKLLIDPRDISRLLRHPLLTAPLRRKFSPQKLLSIYYDTPELTLHKNKIAVRLRKIGKRWVQTVKTEGSVAAGLHQRPEWECEARENTLDFTALPNGPLREFFADEEMRQSLRPMFTTEFARTRRMLEWPEEDVVEFSLDQGEIRAGERAQPISEVELELKSGSSGRLFELALGLQDVIPLRLENVSKAERGYQLALGTSLAPQKAVTPMLNPDEPPAAAFVRSAQSCIAHLQANEKGALSSDDPEFVHQMRVASRRLRSAFRIFSSLIAKESLTPIREELRWFAGELDGARNWDVFMLQTLPSIHAAFPDHDGLHWLVAQSTELRRQANARAREAVTSTRYQKLLLTLGSWLSTNAWKKETEIPELSLVAFASQLLQKHRAKLKKRGRSLTAQTPAERHATRIAAKKARYAAEFFSSLFPRKRTQRYLRRLSALQDILGAMNDSATAVMLMEQLAASENDVQQTQAKGIIWGWTAGKSHSQLQALETTWNAFHDRKLFWRT